MPPTQDWLVTIFKVTGRDAQQLILRVMHQVSGITALGTNNGRAHFVVIECRDPSSADTVQQLVSSLDVGAVLTHVSQSPRPPMVPVGGIA